jgi:hypothetical protein
MKRLSFWVIATLVSACALIEQPTAELSAARAAIADARSAGAAAWAPQELGSAEARLARAESHARLRHYDEALFFAEQAEADARLAAVKSRAASAESSLGTRQQRPQ